jgi:hypothetical protein
MNHVRLISAVRLSITLGKLLIIFHKLTPHPKQRFERRLQTQQMISLETPSIDVCNKWLLENLAKVYLAHLFLLRYKDKFFHCPDSFSPPGFCRPVAVKFLTRMKMTAVNYNILMQPGIHRCFCGCHAGKVHRIGKMFRGAFKIESVILFGAASVRFYRRSAPGPR